MRFASDGHRGTKVLLGALGVLLWVALSALLSSTAAHADDRGTPPAKRTETVAAASADPNAHTPKRAAAASKAPETKAPPVSPSVSSTPSVSGTPPVSSTAPAPKAERRAEQAASPAPRGDARPAAPSSIGDVARETVGAVATEPVGASVQASKVVTTAKTAKALTQAEAARQAKAAAQARSAVSKDRAKNRAHARELPPAAAERADGIQRDAADLAERAKRSHAQHPSASHGWRHSDADTASHRHPLSAPPTVMTVISATVTTAAAPGGTAADSPDAPAQRPGDTGSTGVHSPPAAPLSAASGAANGAPFAAAFPAGDALVDALGVLLAAARAADDILPPAPVCPADVFPD